MTKHSVLIINADKQENDRLIRWLENDYNVITSGSLKEAATLLELTASKIHMILLSLDFPEESVLDFFTQAKNLTPLAEIIVFSRTPRFEAAVSVLKLGAYDFILTPFHEETLKHVIRQISQNLKILDKTKEMIGRTLLSREKFRERLEELQQILVTARQQRIQLSEEEISKFLTGDLASFAFQDSSAKGTVLVIEDDDMLRDILEELLKKSFHCLTAPTGKEALEIAGTTEDIDIMLLDIHLPDIRGDKLLPSLKEKKPDSQIIVMTAFKEVDIAVTTLKNGAVDYINKPFYEEDLKNTIMKALQKKVLQRVLPLVEQRFIQEELSFKERVNTLNALCQNRLTQKKDILMKDVYTLFPELKECRIDENVPLPGDIVSKNMEEFIQKLTHSLEMMKTMEDAL